ncbi:prephenate dehydrogenase/arogenate dehydrogenase family protein [Methylobacterium terrae]|uniref:Prephenate dehydrogenase/arogenate dehydrogenase family protein n=1 Tax=Methylobacterium terrae TaxID=2202827 RepID=A0A2U8WNL3_9HYPH|nr:prephenate dehydrogenase [Methylobacterium terrae]AWN47855.1 prephenate dehydrogenase/arogenate dehydrogenase family protein [Methylobacterium terrae]
MPSFPHSPIGLIGFGAFGRLVAEHLAPHVGLRVHDPFVAEAEFAAGGVAACSLPEAAACPVVILATPVSSLAAIVRAVAPHLRPGALVLDVGSVKVRPAAIMRAGLPPDVDIVATHPLFGPQSARGGLRGLKIAVCPVRGSRAGRVGAFLRRAFGLDVIVTTPEAHDREAAAVQGLTHLIAKVLVAMEPLPTRMTTRSFDLVMQAVGMVRHDAPEVYHAIERENPYAAEVRRRFFDLAARMDEDLGEGAGIEERVLLDA